MLGLFVLLNNPHSTTFRWYFAFSLLSAAWIVSNALSIKGVLVDLHGDTLLLASQCITPFSLWTLMAYFYFLGAFRYKHIGRQFYIFAVPTVGVSLLSFTSLNVKLVDGEPHLGILYPFYVAVLLFNLLLAFRILLPHTVKRRNVVANEQMQLVYLRIGSIGTFVPAFALGIIPSLTNSYIANLAPAFTIVFLAAAAIAMVRHRLFDLRLVVARSLGYGSSLVVVALLYGLVVFGLMSFAFDVRISLWAQAFISIMTGVAALVFVRFQKWFNRTTDRLFYQDAYDPQALFEQLNKILVSSLDVKFLMDQSVALLQSSLRPEHVIVGLRDGEDHQRFFGGHHEFAVEDIRRVRQLTPHIHQHVILTDYLDDGHQSTLKRILQENGVAALVRLTQDVASNTEGLGYIILGPRKSGDPYSNQDVRTLESIANALVVAIQNALHYEEVQHFNLTLRERVDKATRELRRTNEKLRQLDATKDDFISMASHQLRTPLTSIKGYLSMVLEGDAGKLNAQQTQMLTQSYASSQRMVYLISDLLNLSRLNTGKFVIDAAPMDLAEAIQTEVNQLDETAKAREVVLTYHKPKDFPMLMLDETKIHQVVMNFLDNAIYYTPAGGHITVSLTETPTAVEYRVQDDGIGVPKHERAHLFTKFYRAGNARKARPDGTGLGLFMAKKVVLAQGGSIIFESEEGKGSTFGFRFSKNDHAIPEVPALTNTVAYP